jgi:hypothetical protein
MESCNPLETPILCDASPNAMSSWLVSAWYGSHEQSFC